MRISSTPNSLRHCSHASIIALAFSTSNLRARRKLRPCIRARSAEDKPDREECRRTGGAWGRPCVRGQSGPPRQAASSACREHVAGARSGSRRGRAAACSSGPLCTSSQPSPCSSCAGSRAGRVRGVEVRGYVCAVVAWQEGGGGETARWWCRRSRLYMAITIIFAWALAARALLCALAAGTVLPVGWSTRAGRPQSCESRYTRTSIDTWIHRYNGPASQVESRHPGSRTTRFHHLLHHIGARSWSAVIGLYGGRVRG